MLKQNSINVMAVLVGWLFCCCSLWGGDPSCFGGNEVCQHGKKLQKSVMDDRATSLILNLVHELHRPPESAELESEGQVSNLQKRLENVRS